MKKVLSALLLTVMLISFSGCVVAIGNSSKGSGSKSSCKDPQVVNATIAEIDAVEQLHTEGSRLNVYMAIAERPLSPKERTHLIDAAMDNLNTEGSREQILLKLAQNPTPCHPPTPILTEVKEQNPDGNP